jgi:hypothetical protein
MGTIIFTIIYLVLGFIILWSCINQFSDSKKKLKWLITDAKISESEIGSSKDQFRVHATPARNLKKVFVKYIYTINEIVYTDQIPISLKSNYLPLIEKQLEKYPVGKPLKVYYNPENPEESQLNKPGFSIRSIFGYLFFFMLGLFLFAYALYGIVLVFFQD